MNRIVFPQRRRQRSIGAEAMDGAPSRSQRVASFVGRPVTLLLLVGVDAFWISFNALAPSLGLRAPDPAPFAGLQRVTLVLLIALLFVLARVQAEQRKRLRRRVAYLRELARVEDTFLRMWRNRDRH